MTDREHFTEHLQALTLAALEQGTAAATVGKDDFAPFALVDAGGGSAMKVAAGEQRADAPLQEQLEGLRGIVREVAQKPDSTVRAAALVYDTFLTLDDERSDAVVVESYERAQPAGVMVALRYTPRRALRKGRVQGQPTVLSDTDPMF